MNSAFDIEIGPNYFILGLLNANDLGFGNYKMNKIVIYQDPMTNYLTTFISDQTVFNPNSRYYPSDTPFKYIGIKVTADLPYTWITNYMCIDLYKNSFSAMYGLLGFLTDTLKAIDSTSWFLGFNNDHYDDYILNEFVNKCKSFVNNHKKLVLNNHTDSDCQNVYDFFQELLRDLYQMSKKIIELDKKPNVFKQLKTIDLKKVARTDKSLKLIGSLLKYPMVMDFPLDPHKIIDISELENVFNYLTYDLEITLLFSKHLSPALKLRKDTSIKYGINVMSEDNTGIANVLFEKMYCDYTKMTEFELKNLRRKAEIPRRVRISDIINKNISFKTQHLKDYLESIKNIIIKCDEDKITGDLPEVKINNQTYTLGTGGLHSKDDSKLFVSDSEYLYKDADVTSYYLFLIILNKLYPSYLSEAFCKLLLDITNQRVAAKKSDPTVAAILKIVALSIFGKLGEKFSWYYSPETFLATTVNGQLYLLMLAESLELLGIEVVSANTDGIVSKIHHTKMKEYQDICDEWMRVTGFNLEYKDYKVYARRNVSSYVSYDMNNVAKTKGEFHKDLDLDKGQDAKIISKAVLTYIEQRYLHNNPVDLSEIISTEKYIKFDIHDYLYARKPVDRNWENITITPMGTVTQISKTVRFAVVKKSFDHKVRLFKYHTKISNYKKKTSYIANEYIGIMNQTFGSYQVRKEDLKLDFYIKEAKELASLFETGGTKNIKDLFG